jgi:hypothetical protein
MYQTPSSIMAADVTAMHRASIACRRHAIMMTANELMTMQRIGAQ